MLKPPKPAWGWTEVAFGAGSMIPCMLAAGVIYALGFQLITGRKPEVVELALQSQLLAYFAWLGLAAMLFRTRHLHFGEQMRWRWPEGGVGVYLALGPALVFGLGLAGKAMNIQETEMPLIETLLGDPVSRVLFLLFGVSLGPAVEELLFRGIALPVVAHATGVWPGLLLTSLPFALIHGAQYSWSWQHLALLVLAGMAFGWVRLRSDSTLAATLTHCAYNLAMFAGYFLTKG